MLISKEDLDNVAELYKALKESNSFRDSFYEGLSNIFLGNVSSINLSDDFFKLYFRVRRKDALNITFDISCIDKKYLHLEKVGFFSKPEFDIENITVYSVKHYLTEKYDPCKWFIRYILQSIYLQNKKNNRYTEIPSDYIKFGNLSDTNIVSSLETHLFMRGLVNENTH